MILLPSGTKAAGLSLVFPAGRRPSVDDVARLAETAHVERFPFTVSHAPDSGRGAIELIAVGLAFDLLGASPAAAEPMPQVAHAFGLPQSFNPASGEAIALYPGAHLAGGENLLPVVRAMAGIAAGLAMLPEAEAVLWHPARNALSAPDFVRLVEGWLAGGAFPAVGLTALIRDEDGSLTSEGLAFFTGQEVRIEPMAGQDAAGLARIAVRLIHSLAPGAAIAAPCEFAGPEGETLRAEPLEGGRLLRVWRADA